MNKLYLFIVMLALPLFSAGQNDSIIIKLFNSWYDLNSEKKRQSDLYTYEFSDSSITVVAKNKYRYGLIPDATDLRIIPVEDINKVFFRRKGKKLIGLATGLCGALIGGIYGYSRGSTTVEGSDGNELFSVSAGFKSFVGVVIVGGIGFGIGISIGSAKKGFRIENDIGKYQEMKPELIKYAISYYKP
jgi:hypothetical protein